MTQLGEAIAVDIFIAKDEEHNEKTCPWHDDSEKPAAVEMEVPNPETDGDSPSMPKNDGGKLGKNLAEAGEEKPEGELTLHFAPDEVLKWKKGDKELSVRSYSDKETETYELQYAPHHLIPGNESLGRSALVSYLGDDTVIKNFAKNGQESYIKDGQSVGYDVNCPENGVWLPSPYALSMKNEWPSDDGKKRILKIKGTEHHNIAVSFQKAYVSASIEISGNRQFHMRHKDYSIQVQKVLDKIAAKLEKMEDGACKIASDSKEDGKLDAPLGLVARLNVLSAQLKVLLIGPVWHKKFFGDDKLMTEYLSLYKEVKGLKADIVKVI